MAPSLSRALTVSALSMCIAVLGIASCTRTTDRVIEPVGASDASTTTPELADAGLSPIGPMARSPEREPPPDFSLVRSPELGLAGPRTDEPRTRLAAPSSGGSGGAAGDGGYSGSDRRPVSSGGGLYY